MVPSCETAILFSFTSKSGESNYALCPDGLEDCNTFKKKKKTTKIFQNYQPVRDLTNRDLHWKFMPLRNYKYFICRQFDRIHKRKRLTQCRSKSKKLHDKNL